AHPVEAEAHLGFAALADLMEPMLDEVAPALAEPQRHALAVALLRERPGPGRLDQRAVSAATLSVLRLVASEGPLILAIDDLQWLDRPSARVLEFALRRLGRLPVGMLACERLGEDPPVPLDVTRTLPAGRVRRIRLGPVSLAALHHLLKEQLGRSFPHRMLVRVEQVSGGNPFFALELARGLPPDASVAAALRLPETLRRVVDDRLTGLPRAARTALLVAAAAAGSPTVDLVTSAMPGPREDSLRALDQSVDEGVIGIDGPRIRFTHPLFAAGVYSSAAPSERRLVHRRLAALVDGFEEQARHLALGAEAAGEVLAGTLAEAAEHARRRGAPEAAAELAERARALTPPERTSDRHRRSIQAAEYRFHAGELHRAREDLEAVLAENLAERERADALRLLGEIRYQQDSFPEGIALLEESLRRAVADPALRSTIELRLAFGALAMADYDAASRHARGALDLAEHAEEPASLAEALASVAILDLLAGHGLDEAKVRRALLLEDPLHQAPFMMRPSRVAGYLAFYAGDLSLSDRLLSQLRGRILDAGEESDLPFVDSYLTWSACWRGDLSAAAAYGEEGLEAAVRMGSDSLRCMALAFAALPPAYAGDADLVGRRTTECLALASRTGRGLSQLWAGWARALLALSRDDPRGADAALGPLSAPFERDGVPEPIRAFFLPDEIEALVGLGRLDRAERLLAVFEEAARRGARRWALMLADRSRAVLLAASGDLDGAAAAAGRALEACNGLELRIEAARSLLVAGQVERRRRRKRAAADHLERAIEQFDRSGALLWAQRARAELGRVGLRRSSSAALTDSELRVAELTASGLTNRQVAAQMFISPKTVEANLARVYRKLGIRSRAELGARLASVGTTPTQQ
ncbi:MAG: LuxR C-terminal-related transcriptional regulator, partial [Actinomycetota bacterium]